MPHWTELPAPDRPLHPRQANGVPRDAVRTSIPGAASRTAHPVLQAITKEPLAQKGALARRGPGGRPVGTEAHQAPGYNFFSIDPPAAFGDLRRPNL